MKVLFSITFSFLTLFSSLNWAVSTHFCQDKLQNLSLFGEAKSCHDQHDHDPVMKDCPIHGEMPASLEEEPEDDCCEDHSFNVDGQELDVIVPHITIDIVLPVVLAVLGEALPMMNTISSNSDEFVVNNHSPPDLPEILSLIQVYRL